MDTVVVPEYQLMSVIQIIFSAILLMKIIFKSMIIDTVANVVP